MGNGDISGALLDMSGLGGGAQRVCTVCVSQESLATNFQVNVIIYTLRYFGTAPFLLTFGVHFQTIQTRF